MGLGHAGVLLPTRAQAQAGMTGRYGAQLGVFATSQRRQNGLQAPSATDGQETAPVSVDAALAAQKHRASFTQVPSRFRARLPGLSPTGC